MVIDTNVKYKEIPYCFEVRKVCFNYNQSYFKFDMLEAQYIKLGILTEDTYTF